MPSTSRPSAGGSRGPIPRLPVLSPARGPAAVAAYLRVHLYGAAVGRSLLDRCIRAVDPTDRALLTPMREQFDDEIDVAHQLLARLTMIGTPGRRLVRLSSRVGLAALPAGPWVVDPLTRLGALEALRTLVVAKRSMWEILADSWVAGAAPDGDDGEAGDLTARDIFLGLAEQAATQEEVLEALRRVYGLAAFG
ncbi:MAG TPA: hypothetical protein GX694_07000 [Actinomycetales bacterium]|nr:hypothetical protein [Actinomycetales bacterium]